LPMLETTPPVTNTNLGPCPALAPGANGTVERGMGEPAILNFNWQ
jgi:hypothetical protein